MSLRRDPAGEEGVYQWPLTCGERGPYFEASAVSMCRGTVPALWTEARLLPPPGPILCSSRRSFLEGSHPLTEARAISLWHDPAWCVISCKSSKVLGQGPLSDAIFLHIWLD